MSAEDWEALKAMLASNGEKEKQLGVIRTPITEDSPYLTNLYTNWPNTNTQEENITMVEETQRQRAQAILGLKHENNTLEDIPNL